MGSNWFKVSITLLVLSCTSCSQPLVQPNATLRPPEVNYASATLTNTATITTISATSTITITPTSTHTNTSTFTPTNTPTPTMFPTRDPSATSTIVPTYLPISDLPEPHFWLDRPISDEYNDYVIPTYRYGSTQGGILRVHHGVDFVNSLGTPIKSTISGKVVFAGSDYYAKLGPTKDFYGRAIIVHTFNHFLHQPVFVLYGHLDTILVSKGQTVETGTILGTVGGAGVAKGGSHLHMEIRVGHNDYLSTRNPELWIRPYPDWGTLAGRITDNNGKLIPLVNITVISKQLDETDISPVRRYLTTYAEGPVNPDEILGENFALADLPPGIYTVGVNTGGTIQRQDVTILPDILNWIEFVNVNPPLTWTPTPITTPTPKQ